MASNYALSFLNQTLIQIPAALHGLGHQFLRCQVYDSGTPRQRLRAQISVDPSTFLVTVQLLQMQSGIVVLNGAAPLPGGLGNHSFPFSVTAGGTVTISGTQHGFGTDHLLVDLYDDQVPRVWLPQVTVAIDPNTFAVSAAFLQPQAGVMVICAEADVGIPNQGYPVALPAGGTLTIAGPAHGLGTANMGFQLYDTLGTSVVPGQVTVHPTTYAITISTLDTLTGTLVINGSTAGAVAGPRMVIAQGGSLLLGGASQGQRGTGVELTTGYYTFTFVDEAEQSVPASVIETLRLTYYDTSSGAIINSRDHQNVLNANYGVLASTAGPPAATTFTVELVPADAAILDQSHPSEPRTLLFQWTWAGGQRAGAHTAQFTVTNLTHVP